MYDKNNGAYNDHNNQGSVLIPNFLSDKLNTIFKARAFFYNFK